MKLPEAGSEPIDIRTTDGWSLRSEVHEPSQEPVGVAVFAHALMARRTEFSRPRGAGLVRLWVDRGWRVVTFDFRGHGDSDSGPRPSPAVGYDDFVLRDLPAVYDFARFHNARGRPAVLVGHSLGGHAALASQGAGRVAFDGIVAVGASVWLRELEPSMVRWLAKRASLAAAAAVARRLGWFPARALRLGSDDVSRACIDDLERFARTGRWQSSAGDVDYLASLDRVRVPLLQIVSDGDRIECPPDCGARFVAHCGGRPETMRIALGDDGGPPPDHMGIVTSGRARGVWERAEAWTRREVTRAPAHAGERMV